VLDQMFGIAEQARGSRVVGDHVIVRPGWWGVGQYDLGDCVVLPFASQEGGDGDDQPRKTARGEICLGDELLAEPDGAVRPPLVAVWPAPFRWTGFIVFGVTGRCVRPAGDR